MKIRVLFFASLREAVEAADIDLELKEGSFGALRVALVESLGERADPLWEDNVRLSVNQRLIEDLSELVIEDGDELAFLPPVTGG